MPSPSRAAEPAAAGRPHWLTPLAFAGGFLLVGLLTLDAYGPSWDEPLHRGWGEATWAYLRTGDPRLVTELPGGGRHYGPIFYLLNYGVSRVAHDVAGMDFTAANHLFTLLTAAVGVWCTFLLAETLFNRRVAVAATTLLVLLPPFLAHGQYNPKDVPLLTLVAATLLFGTMAYRTRRALHAAVAGALLGIATAMKPTAVVVLPILGGAILIGLLPHRWSELRSITRLTALAAAAALASLFVSWPILWRQPGQLLSSLAYFARGGFWTGNVLYFGALTPATELPWHYMPVMLLLSFPLVASLLATTGAAVLARRLPDPASRFPAALLLLWIALPLLLFMKPGLARYDGMRQIFFVVPAVVILAGAGWDALRGSVAADARGRRLFMLVSMSAAVWLGVECVRAFPYGGSYVNAPARALLGPHLEHRFEIEYWGVTYREGLRWLQRTAEPNSVICVPIASPLVAWQPETARPDLSYDCSEETRYVMLMTRFSEWPDAYHPLRERAPIFTISRFGSDLLRIYSLP